MKKKNLVALLAVVMVFAVTVGATIAWLQDSTQKITNTFTIGNIDIDLKETTEDYKMVPGHEISKDPKVTVVKDSENCWLFVEIEESDNLDDFITYEVAADWEALDETTYQGVYYRQVDTSTSDQTFSVLTDDKVSVNSDVTKAMMDEIDAGTEAEPILAFTAYAIQRDDNIANAADAWKEIKGIE